MIDNLTLGKRLKFFRERAHISQFDLESQMGAASGMISRIESGKVNPSKETVLKLAEIYLLNRWETDYLIGRGAEPPTQKEIALALNEVKDQLSDSHYLGYVGDDRWVLYGFSKGFLKLLGATQKDVDAVLGKTIIEVLLDEKLGITKFFDQEKYNELVKLQLAYYYVETGFMQDDPIFQRALNAIRKNKFANEVWENLSIEKSKGFLSNDTRIVNFKVGPFQIPMKYSREPLLRYSRFEMMEYVPVNKVTKLVMKLLG